VKEGLAFILPFFNSDMELLAISPGQKGSFIPIL
jgi:hypothetical protein